MNINRRADLMQTCCAPLFVFLIVAAILWTMDWANRGLIRELSEHDARYERFRVNAIRNDIGAVRLKIEKIRRLNQRSE